MNEMPGKESIKVVFEVGLMIYTLEMVKKQKTFLSDIEESRREVDRILNTAFEYFMSALKAEESKEIVELNGKIVELSTRIAELTNLVEMLSIK